MVIRSYTLIITLNVNILNAPTKRHWLGGWKRASMYFHLPHYSVWPSKGQYVQ